MPIYVVERTHPGSIVSKHWLRSPIGDNKELIILTGVIKLNMKGEGNAWRQEIMLATIEYPHILPTGKRLHLENWTVFVTLNAINNLGPAVNGGWAVDEFWLDSLDSYYYGPLTLAAKVAVSDIDGWLYRVGYQVTLKGPLEDLHY